MKKASKIITYVVLVGLIGASGYFTYLEFLDPCQKTLEYSIGRFDTDFGITREQFKSYLVESEKVWEGTIGRELFVYNPVASFKINLIYDERQLQTVQKQKDEFGLTAIENIFKKIDSDFVAYKSEYDKKVASYKEGLVLYEAKKLTNKEIKQLNAEAEELNNISKILKTLLDDRNAKAIEYNEVAKSYNEKYGSGAEFNQAEYTGSAINVYQFGNKKDLVLALSHEFGHALGMDHVENPDSLMYYLTDGNTSNVPVLSKEDLFELQKVCKIK